MDDIKAAIRAHVVECQKALSNHDVQIDPNQFSALRKELAEAEAMLKDESLFLNYQERLYRTSSI